MALTFTTGYTFTDGDIVTRTKLNNAVNSATYTGTLEVAKGGTGSTTAADARANLGHVRARSSARVDISALNTTYVDIPDLSVNLTTGITYHIRAHVPLRQQALGTKIQFTGTATFSSVSGMCVHRQTNNVGGGEEVTAFPYENDMAISNNGDDRVYELWVIATCNGSGTLKVQFAKFDALAGTIRACAGATLEALTY